MAIRIEERQPGYYRVNIVWPQGLGVRVTLHLTDPDGESEDDVFEWMAPQDYPLQDAIDAVIAAVDGITHWRAVWLFGEIVIEPASDDYTGEITVEML